MVKLKKLTFLLSFIFILLLKFLLLLLIVSGCLRVAPIGYVLYSCMVSRTCDVYVLGVMGWSQRGQQPPLPEGLGVKPPKKRVVLAHNFPAHGSLSPIKELRL
jgi:hypothetical protein